MRDEIRDCMVRGGLLCFAWRWFFARVVGGQILPEAQMNSTRLLLSLAVASIASGCAFYSRPVTLEYNYAVRRMVPRATHSDETDTIAQRVAEIKEAERGVRISSP